MSFHFFTIPAWNPGPAQAELNAFLAQGRVLRMTQQFIADGPNSAWAFCVELADGPGPLPPSLRAGAHQQDAAGAAARPGKSIDYREVLSDPDFALFASLRDWRKGVAQRENVPPYAIFTNAQLAEMARLRVASRGALGNIDGVGPARVDKYADELLAWLATRQGTAAAAAVPTPAGDDGGPA